MRQHQNGTEHFVQWFDSFDEWLDYSANTVGEQVSVSSFNTSRGSNIHSVADAVAAAREGKAAEGLEALEYTERRLTELQRDLVSQRWQKHPDVEGMVVDIGRYVQGIPENMMSMRRYPKRKPQHVVTMVIAIGVRAGISEAAYRKRGHKIMSVVEAIEHSGLQTEIWLDKTAEGYASGGTNTARQAILYKRAGERYDAASLMWVLTDIAAHRVIGFNAMHGMPRPFLRSHHVGSGYGGSTMKARMPHPEDYPDGENALYFRGLSSNSEAESMSIEDVLKRLDLLLHEDEHEGMHH